MKPLSDWEKPTPVSFLTSCQQAARLVSISFERKLSCREFFVMRLHLLMCKTCTFYRRQISALRCIFKSHAELLDQTPPSDDEKLSPNAKDRIKRKLCP